MQQKEKVSAIEHLTKNVFARIGTVVTVVVGLSTALYQLTRDVVLTVEGVALVLVIVTSAFVVAWRTTKVEGEKPVPFFPKNPRLIAGAVLIAALGITLPYLSQVSNILIKREALEKQLAEIRFLTLTPHPTSTTIPGAQQTATAAARSAWPLVFSDSFTSNANNWSLLPSNQDKGTIIRTIANGKYRVGLKANTGRLIAVEIPKIRALVDLYVTVDAQRISGPTSADYGIFFRLAEQGLMYAFTVTDDRGILLQATMGEKGFVLARLDQLATIKPGGVNRLGVVAQGTRFELFVNDQSVTALDDTRYKQGFVGFWVGLNAGEEAVFEFSNLQVRAP